MTGASPLIVAVDGPSGVGKSTAARRLAARLGLPFMDTGAMYRAIGLKVLANGVDPQDRNAVVGIAGESDVRLGRGEDGSFEVLLDGEPVEARIRTPEVGEATSAISAYPEVRQRMVRLQREAAGPFGAVLEGRDIGTRVFPETPHKFFLDARPEVRYQRRFEELAAAGRPVTYGQVVDEITRRDLRDSTRADSPLTRDGSYTLIDSSDLTIDEVVERMAREVEGRAD
ncbi:MAG TPA: (d)CMP kinase [Thermoanaerobaculia bacterium]|jgi:cytidylate kinase